jgi:hypothetical protein
VDCHYEILLKWTDLAESPVESSGVHMDLGEDRQDLTLLNLHWNCVYFYCDKHISITK